MNSTARTPEEVRRAIRAASQGSTDPATHKQRGYVASLLNQCFGGDDAYDPDKDRRTVMRYLLDKVSVYDLTKGEAGELIGWLRDTETGGVDIDAEQEAHRILHQPIKQAGQTDMFENRG